MPCASRARLTASLGSERRQRFVPIFGLHSKMMRHQLLPIAAALCLSTAAQPTSSGTELWVTYMENLDLQFNTPPYFELVISSDVVTQGEVQVPATGYVIPFSVPAQHDTVITLPTNIYYPEGDEDVFDFGLRVVADDPVNVYAYHHRLYFSEACMALPYDRLGSEYLVLAHEDAVNTSPSEFVVLATADSTVVEIVPSVLTVGFRPPGVPYTVLLDEGQAFQQQAFGDLSGSRVRSLDPTKPVAVFAGARQARVNCQLSADDHLYQQIEPVANWGRLFHIVPFKFRGGDELRVLSGSDNNTISITGQAPVVLDSGEVADVFMSAPSAISATAPVAVGQFNESQNCNPASGDPSYLWIQPSTLQDERAVWSALTGAGTPEHFVNAVVGGEAGAPVLFLDGVDVSAQLQPMSGVPGIFWGQYSISAGEHKLECTSGMEAWAYGFGDYNSYSYPLGYGSSPLANGIEDLPGGTQLVTTLLLTQGSTFEGARWGLDTGSQQLVIDATGRVVCTLAPAERYTIGLASGHYVLRSADANEVKLLRLIIQ